MDERRVHVYGSGRGFAVVPVCYHSEKGWVECEPVQEVGLEKGLPIRVIFEEAIERAAQHPCSDLQVCDVMPGGWRDHHLFAAHLVWRAGTLQLFILPDAVPAKEWPENVPIEYPVRRLIEQLGRALA
jgi:hypothetical protein